MSVRDPAPSERMAAGGVTGTLLQSEWEAIGNADDDVRRFCIAAAQLGLDPYSVDESVADALISAAGG